MRDYMQARKLKNPKKYGEDLGRWRKRKYGITNEDYERMLAEQRGLCAGCSNPETKVVKGTVVRLSIDHDHTTGKVRGLLCDLCNRAVGMMRDSATTARRLAMYLDQHSRDKRSAA